MVLLAIGALATAGQSVAFAQDTVSSKFSNFGAWQVEAIHSIPVGRESCNAAANISGTRLMVSARGYRTSKGINSLSLVVPQDLPAQYKGAAKLLIDGKEAATGTLEHTGDWSGGKLVTSYALVRFDNFESALAQLKDSHTVTISGDQAVFHLVTFRDAGFDRVAIELEKCRASLSRQE